MEKELLDKLKYLLNKGYKIEDISNILNLDMPIIYNLINGDKGHIPVITEPYIIPNKKDYIRILLMGDSHLANRADRIDLLRAIYYKAEDTNTDLVLHCGDFVDGYPLIDGYEKVLRENTFIGQKQYAIENYPMYSGNTYVISGNHDDYWYQRELKDILKEISKEREDIINLGYNRRDMQIGNIRIKLIHGNPDPYIGSRFKPNKFINSLDTRIDIIHTGHMHISHYDKFGDTYCFRTAGLMNRTPYTRDKGYKNEKSVYWLNLYLNSDGKLEKVKHKREIFK